MRSLSRASLLVLLVAACGSGDPPSGDDGGGTDGAAVDGTPAADASPPDAPPPDASPPDAAPPLTPIGQPCPTGTECPTMMGSICLDEDDGFPGEGYCSLGCTADADCGPGAFCSPDLGGGGRLCFAACGPAGTCDAGRVCGQFLGGFLDLGQPACVPGNAAAIDGSACSGFFSCNADQGCISNPFSLPGGYCVTVGCTVGDDSTCAPGGDGRCIPQGMGGLCVDGCTTAADCRTAEGYTCVTAAPGTQICLYPAAGPGAPCTDATECGPAGSPWQCLTGAGFPGGYCGATGCDPADEQTCPLDATCYDATPGALDGTEFCGRNCTSNMDCRMGYQCLPSGVGMQQVCR